MEMGVEIGLSEGVRSSDCVAQTRQGIGGAERPQQGVGKRIRAKTLGVLKGLGSRLGNGMLGPKTRSYLLTGSCTALICLSSCVDRGKQYAEDVMKNHADGLFSHENVFCPKKGVFVISGDHNFKGLNVSVEVDGKKYTEGGDKPCEPTYGVNESVYKNVNYVVVVFHLDDGLFVRKYYY